MGIRTLNAEEIASGARLPTCWFHAASVGELETLWPVAVELAGSGDEKREFIFTVLSSSARERVAKLAQVVSERGAKVRFCGYSPWEGDWREALHSLGPEVFVTAKYEPGPNFGLRFPSSVFHSWLSERRLVVPSRLVGEFAGCLAPLFLKCIFLPRWSATSGS